MAMDMTGLRFGKPRARVLVQQDKKRTLGQQERSCRVAIRRRDQRRCRVCDKPSTHLHHLTRRSLGGKWLTDNIVALCTRCHRADHGAVLYLSGNPNISLYWEWLCVPLPGLVKPWGYSRPPNDRRGPGDRFHGRME